MTRIGTYCLHVTISLVSVCAYGGCTWLYEDRQKLDLGVDPALGPLANSAAYRDTIGAYTYYDGMRPMRVRGYGLVVGLGKNGSRDCPRNVYDRLVQSLYKQHEFSSNVVGVTRITPEQLIDDIDTAVVVVQGEIPYPSGAEVRFKVSHQAITRTHL